MNERIEEKRLPKNFGFLGIGSAFNPRLGNNSMLYREGNNFYLFDCGYTSFQRIVTYNPFNILDECENLYILISHLHSDHVCGLIDLCLYFHFNMEKSKVQIIYPGEKKDIMEILNVRGYSLSSFENIEDLLYEYHKPFPIFDTSDVEVSVLHMNHYTEDDTKDAFSFLIYLRKHDYIIYYSGDTNDPNISNVDWLSFNLYDRCPDRYYIEMCYPDYENNCHNNYKKFDDSLKSYCMSYNSLNYDHHRYDEMKNKIYAMHLDNDILIPTLENMGYHIAELI